MTQKQQTINNNLLEELSSTNTQVAMQAIEKIKSVASEEIIPGLLKVWYQSNGELYQKIEDLLYSVKNKQKAEKILIQELKQEKSSVKREKLIAVFWNAKLNPVNNLSLFVKIATEGTYMECLECHTLIENMEGPYPEQQLLESMLILKEYFGKNKSDEKRPLLQSIATIIQYRDEVSLDD
jgi:hypothetical protein